MDRTPVPYAPEAQSALLAGQQATADRRAARFEPEALLVGLLERPDGQAAMLLRALGVASEDVWRDAERTVRDLMQMEEATEVSIASAALRAVLERAEAEADAAGSVVGPGHLLLGLAAATESPGRYGSAVARVLSRHGVTPGAVRRAMARRHGLPDAPPLAPVGPPHGTAVMAAVDGALLEAVRASGEATAAFRAVLLSPEGDRAEKVSLALSWLERAPAVLEQLGRLRGNR